MVRNKLHTLHILYDILGYCTGFIYCCYGLWKMQEGPVLLNHEQAKSRAFSSSAEVLIAVKDVDSRGNAVQSCASF